MTLLLVGHGNSEDNLKNYPYVVGIGYSEANKDFHACTGTLIKENWVITAGDCIEQDRSYYVVITHSNGGNITMIRKIFRRYLKDSLNFDVDDYTILGLLQIGNISANIETYPTLFPDNLAQFQQRLVYVEYVAGLEDESKNNKLKVVNFISSSCIKETRETLYVCVNDVHQVLSKNYGGPLLYKGTNLVGVYSADLIYGKVKRFIAIKPFFHWINEQMGRNVG